MKKLIAAAALPLVLSACSTFVTPRYSIAPDANVALKGLGTSSIAVGSFAAPEQFDNSCRAAGPLGAPDNMTHSEYIRKALEDELKVAGVHAPSNPRVTLSGRVTKLEFSSSRALTGGSWTIQVDLTSSNGKKMTVSEYYEFQSGFVADTACKQTAEAFMPAVQNLMVKTVRSPEFKTLVQ